MAGEDAPNCRFLLRFTAYRSFLAIKLEDSHYSQEWLHAARLFLPRRMEDRQKQTKPVQKRQLRHLSAVVQNVGWGKT